MQSISLKEFSITGLPQHCDDPAPLVGFDINRYVGIWYDQQHTADVWYLNDKDTCGQVEYTELGVTKENEFKVHNTSQSEDFGDRKGIYGKAYCPDTTGQCFVDFGSGYPTKSNYKIVDTDYETFSVVYSCFNVFKPKAWILSRVAEIPEDVYQRARAVIAEQLPKYNKDYDSESIPVQYQGPLCTYNTLPDLFLQ